MTEQLVGELGIDIEQTAAADVVDDSEDVAESHRPALLKLTQDVDKMIAELVSGFESRREILEWMQRLSIRTLGTLPDSFYFDLGAEFRGLPESGQERVFLSALLADSQRERDIPAREAVELRQRLSAQIIRPASHRAFRALRKSAGEYFDNGTDGKSKHSAGLQKYVAMRPSLEELESYQSRALDELVDGFDSRSKIIKWGSVVELASHGEIPESFVSRCYREQSTSAMLCGGTDHDQSGRELFAAVHLLPYFNRGARDLSGRVAEEPEAEKKERQVSLG